MLAFVARVLNMAQNGRRIAMNEERKPETLINIPASDGSGETLLELDAATSVISRVDASTGGRLSTRPLELKSDAFGDTASPTRQPSTRDESFTERLKTSAAASTAGARYEPRSELGRGGMGLVLQMRDNDLRRDVAMKVMRADRVDSSTRNGQVALQRFVEEAQITGQLEHPNIVPIHELGADAGGRVYFTMKMVRGQPLSAILREIRRGDATTIREYPLDRLLQIFLKVCDALSFAHAHNVVHRDLKPDNIMVGRFGEAMVMDWGLARVLDRHEDAEPGIIETDSRSGLDTERKPSVLSMEGSIAGTPAYMAPEQARGEISRIDQRTDIFALGAILYEMLVLKPPYAGEGGSAVLESAAAGRVVDPFKRVAMDEQLRDGLKRLPGGVIPPELAAIAMHALNPRIDDRYPTVRALHADVENFIAGRPVSVRQDPISVRVAKWVRRHPTLSMSSAAAALVLLVSVASIMWIVANARAETMEQQQQIIAAETDAADKERALKVSALEREAALQRRAEAMLSYRAGIEHADRALEITHREARVATFTVAEDALKTAAATDPEFVDPVFALARLYHDFGDDRALAQYMASHQLIVAAGSAQQARPLVYAGDFAFHVKGDVEAAKDYYARAAALDASDPYAVIGQGWVNISSGDWPAALEVAERARDMNDSLWEPWFLLGYVRACEYRNTDTTLNDLFDPDKAEALLLEAKARGINVGSIHLELGNTYMAQRRYADASHAFAMAAERLPGRSAPVQNHALAMVYIGRLDLAHTQAQLSIDHFPEDIGSWTTLGFVQLRMGESEAAAASFEKALAMQPGRVATLNNYAAALHALGRHDEALAALEQVLEIEPGFWRSWLLTSRVLVTKNRFDEALAATEKALKLRPDEAPVLDSMAEALWRLGRLDEAEDFARRAIAEAPSLGFGTETMGAVQMAQRDYPAAIEYYMQALVHEPRSTSILINLAMALERAGRTADSLDYAQRAIALDADNAEAHFRAGVALLLLRRDAEALAAFERAVQADPGHLDAWNNIAHSANRVGRFDLARDAALKASETDPDHVLAIVNLGHAELRLGNRDAAVTAARKAAAFSGRSAHELSEVSRLLWGLQLFAEAEAAAERAVATDADHGRARARLATAQWSLGKLEDALATARKACELMPDDLLARMVEAGFLSDMRRYREAINSARMVLDIDPAYAAAHSLIGGARYNLGEYRLAAESYEAAVRSRRDYALDWLNLGVCWILLNDTRSAIPPLEQATRLDPDFAPGWEYLGLSLHAEGRSQDALEPLGKALALNPDSPGANLSMANALYALGRTGDAQPFARAAARLNPASVNVWYRLGIVEFDLGNWAESAAAFEAGLRVRPEVGSFHYLIAICRVELGEFEAGRKAAKRALELDAQLNSAQIVIARAELGLGNVDEALSNLEAGLIAGADAAWAFTEAWWTAIADDERFVALKEKYGK